MNINVPFPQGGYIQAQQQMACGKLHMPLPLLLAHLVLHHFSTLLVAGLGNRNRTEALAVAASVHILG